MLFYKEERYLKFVQPDEGKYSSNSLSKSLLQFVRLDCLCANFLKVSLLTVFEIFVNGERVQRTFLWLLSFTEGFIWLLGVFSGLYHGLSRYSGLNVVCAFLFFIALYKRDPYGVQQCHGS